MAGENSENKQWTNSKDFGLPYVEVKPLNFKVEEEEKKVVSPSIAEVSEEPRSNTESISTPEIEPVLPEKVFEEAKPEPVLSEPSEEKKAAPSKVIPTPKKSNTWVWIVIVFFFAVVSVIVWQLMGAGQNAQPESTKSISETTPAITNPAVADPSEEITPTEQGQDVVNQDSIAAINNSNPNISNPEESGTTIANTVSGNLIRIESKAEKVRYFIVVSSLPNEQLAKEVAAKFEGKTSELYLITPYESSPNYRVAIGKFDTWKAAADEVAQIKSQYSEDLWILNY